MTGRDRDPQGRARNARPRDALGRPLPHGAAGEERAPEGVVRTPEETVAEAQALLDAGRPFHAHEVLEDAWKSAPDPEKQLWRGLAQVAVGLTHAARGNPAGAGTLLERGAGHVSAHAAARPDLLHGIDVAGVAARARELAADARREGALDPASSRLTLRHDRGQVARLDTGARPPGQLPGAGQPAREDAPPPTAPPTSTRWTGGSAAGRARHL